MNPVMLPVYQRPLRRWLLALIALVGLWALPTTKVQAQYIGDMEVASYGVDERETPVGAAYQYDTESVYSPGVSQPHLTWSVSPESGATITYDPTNPYGCQIYWPRTGTFTIYCSNAEWGQSDTLVVTVIAVP